MSNTSKSNKMFGEEISFLDLIERQRALQGIIRDYEEGLKNIIGNYDDNSCIRDINQLLSENKVGKWDDFFSDLKKKNDEMCARAKKEFSEKPTKI